MKAKRNLKAIKKVEEQDNSASRPMLSLEQSREILNQNGIEYTDEEILIIREFMYQMAEMANHHYHNHRIIQPKIISIKKVNETKSILIRPCKHRRAS